MPRAIVSGGPIGICEAIKLFDPDTRLKVTGGETAVIALLRVMKNTTACRWPAPRFPGTVTVPPVALPGIGFVTVPAYWIPGSN